MMDELDIIIKKIIYGILINEYGEVLTQPRCEKLSLDIRESVIDFLNKRLEN